MRHAANIPYARRRTFTGRVVRHATWELRGNATWLIRSGRYMLWMSI